MVLWLLIEALKVVEPTQKSAEANDSALLNDGSVILRAFFDNVILFLCDVTSWKILVLPMVYEI